MQRNIILAAGAFGVGALLGWAIAADTYENKWKEEREQYEKLLRDKTNHIWALQDRIDYIKKHENEPVRTLKVDEEDDYDVVVEEDDYVVPEGETPEDTRSNLQSLIAMYTANSDETSFENTVETNSDFNRKIPPFVISRTDYAFGDDGENYEKITLTYFPRDRVLLDDEDEPIEDIAGVVGWRSLTQFGVDSDDPEVVFVRNHRLESDFEIIREEGPLPLHVRYGMEKEEFRANKAAGLIKLRQEDE